jgi:uncharacterized membrane protein
MNLVELLFSFLCSQDASRSFVVGGELMPCCQRCTGLYVGIALTVLYLLLSGDYRRGLQSRTVAYINITSLLIMPVFGYHLLDPGPGWRLWSGLIFGNAIAMLLVPSTVLIVKKGVRWGCCETLKKGVRPPEATRHWLDASEEKGSDPIFPELVDPFRVEEKRKESWVAIAFHGSFDPWLRIVDSFGVARCEKRRGQTPERQAAGEWKIESGDLKGQDKEGIGSSTVGFVVFFAGLNILPLLPSWLVTGLYYPIVALELTGVLAIAACILLLAITLVRKLSFFLYMKGYGNATIRN